MLCLTALASWELFLPDMTCLPLVSKYSSGLGGVAITTQRENYELSIDYNGHVCQGAAGGAAP